MTHISHYKIFCEKHSFSIHVNLYIKLIEFYICLFRIFLYNLWFATYQSANINFKDAQSSEKSYNVSSVKDFIYQIDSYLLELH